MAEQKTFFGNAFDFNRDGKLDAFEKAADFGLFVQMMEEETNKNAESDSDDSDSEPLFSHRF